MAARFVSVDHDTPLLLPPDLREWVPADHLVPWVMDAVGQLELGAARRNERGAGDAQYPPGMMLGLLIYSYATGVFSSRQIERATYENVAVRLLCADTHPDHDTLCAFRRHNGARCSARALARCSSWRRAAGCSASARHHRGHRRDQEPALSEAEWVPASASKHSAISYERGSPIHQPPLFPSASLAGAQLRELDLEPSGAR